MKRCLSRAVVVFMRNIALSCRDGVWLLATQSICSTLRQVAGLNYDSIVETAGFEMLQRDCSASPSRFIKVALFHYSSSFSYETLNMQLLCRCCLANIQGNEPKLGMIASGTRFRLHVSFRKFLTTDPKEAGKDISMKLLGVLFLWSMH